jgi:hypothetical protein
MPRSKIVVLLPVLAAALESGHVGDAILVHEDLCDGVIDANAVEVPLTPEYRDDAHAGLGMLHLEQWEDWMRTSSIDGEPVEIDAERGKMEAEILEVHIDSQALCGFLLDQADEIRMPA